MIRRSTGSVLEQGKQLDARVSANRSLQNQIKSHNSIERFPNCLEQIQDNSASRKSIVEIRRSRIITSTKYFFHDSLWERSRKALAEHEF